MGMMFAGTPALVLARRWDAVEAGVTLPRACGPAPAPVPERAPEAGTPPEPVPAPAFAAAPAFLRLGRIDENFDAERRSRRHEGLVRAGY